VFTHVVEDGTRGMEMAVIPGCVGSLTCNITITSITIDGVEVLR
jgi:UDP-N-acetylenolpyruvoylglucosamine reductase